MRTNKLFVVCSLLFLIVLTGCTVEYRTSIGTDGTGRMSMAIGYTAQEASDLAELSGSSTTDLCQEVWAESSADLPPDASIREEQRGDETYCIIEFSFASLDELRSIYDDQGIEVTRLEVVDNRLYYDVSIDMTDADMLGFAFDMTWIVTAPGTVGTNNASSVSGQTLTWDLVVGQVNSMRFESSVGSNWLWWVLGGLGCLCLVVVTIAIIVGVIVFLRKKKSKAVLPAQQ